MHGKCGCLFPYIQGNTMRADLQYITSPNLHIVYAYTRQTQAPFRISLCCASVFETSNKDVVACD